MKPETYQRRMAVLLAIDSAEQESVRRGRPRVGLERERLDGRVTRHMAGKSIRLTARQQRWMLTARGLAELEAYKLGLERGRRQLSSAQDVLLATGVKLSNVAYNLAQTEGSLDEKDAASYRRSAKMLRVEWDERLGVVRNASGDRK